MGWLHCIAYFFGGLFLSNGIPHFVSGAMGRAFPSPFAKPPGRGLSSAAVNVIWGVFNFALSYMLIWRIGEFSFGSTADVVALGLGFLLMGLGSARQFAHVSGSQSPTTPSANSH
jgi:hypothetical protein